MADGTLPEEGCGEPQLLLSCEPNSQWFPEQLGTYAQTQYRQILDGESHLTGPYWRLGHALEIAKKSFGYGQWAKYLESLGIDKTRASKARAIYRTFDHEKDVAGMTVDEAYARRQRKQSTERPNDDAQKDEPKKSITSLRMTIGKIAERTETVVHDAAFAAPEEATILIPAVRKAIRQLETLLQFLEQQAASAQTGSNEDSERC